MARDLKLIYQTAKEEEGASELEGFAEKWEKRYLYVEAS